MVSSAPLRAFVQLILSRRTLLYDDKVLRVNSFIAVMTGWPEDPKLHPHPFAKLLRHCVTVLIYFGRKAKEAIRPINFWVKQHILHSLSKFVESVFKLTWTAFRRAKLAACSRLPRLKHLHFRKSKSLLWDAEVGNNHTPEGTDNVVLSEGVSELDKAVDKFIGYLDTTFVVHAHRLRFKTIINGWNSGMYVCSFLLDLHH